MFNAFTIQHCCSIYIHLSLSPSLPHIYTHTRLEAGPRTDIDAVLRQDAECPSHALYLKPCGQWPQACGLYGHWLYGTKKNRT